MIVNLSESSSKIQFLFLILEYYVFILFDERKKKYQLIFGEEI